MESFFFFCYSIYETQISTIGCFFFLLDYFFGQNFMLVYFIGISGHDAGQWYGHCGLMSQNGKFVRTQRMCVCVCASDLCA